MAAQEKLYEYDQTNGQQTIVKYLNRKGMHLRFTPDKERVHGDTVRLLPAGIRDENTIRSVVPPGFQTVKSVKNNSRSLSREDAVDIIQKTAEAIDNLYFIYKFDRHSGLGYISADNVLYNRDSKEVLLAYYEFQEIYYLDGECKKIDRKRTPKVQDDVEALRKIFQEDLLQEDNVKNLDSKSARKMFELLRKDRHASMKEICNNKKLDLVILGVVAAAVVAACVLLVPYHAAYANADRIIHSEGYKKPQAFDRAMNILVKTKDHAFIHKYQKDAYEDLMKLAGYQYAQTGDASLLDELVEEVVTSFDNQEADFKQKIRFLRVEAYYTRVCRLNEELGKNTESIGQSNDTTETIGQINEAIAKAVEEITLLYDGYYDSPDLYIIWSHLYRIAWGYSVDGNLKERFQNNEMIALNDGLLRLEDNLLLLIEKAYILSTNPQEGSEASAEMTGAASTEMTGATNAEMTGTEMTGATNTEMAGTTNAEMTGATNADMTGTASREMTGTASAEMTGATSEGMAGTINADMADMTSMEMTGTENGEMSRLKKKIDREYERIRDSGANLPYEYDTRDFTYYNNAYGAFVEWFEQTVVFGGGIK